MVTNCYSTGSVSGNGTIGGLVGLNDIGTVTNCYATGSVSGDWKVGGLVGWNTYEVSESFWDTQTSGRSNMCGGGSGSGCDNSYGKTTAQMQDISTFLAAGWDFVGEFENGPNDDWAQGSGGGYMTLWWQLSPLPPLPTFSGGTGEPNDPYLISTTTDLNRIGHNPRLIGAHFKLTSDIDLAGIDFFIISNYAFRFAGVFDGSGHTISNFTYSVTGADYVGLFRCVSGADTEVKNLGLINPSVEGGDYDDSFGSLVGYFVDGTVSGCYVEGGSVSGNNKVGGLVGENSSGLITNCYVVGSVSGDDKVGGLVGKNDQDGTISNCYSSATISGDESVGGLAGSSSGIITNCYSAGSVSGDNRVGGLAGYGGNISNCYSTASVLGVDRVGGLVGQGGRISNSYAAGSVSGGEYVGGLVGYDSGSNNYTKGFWDYTVNPDVNGIGNTTDANVIGESTANMQTRSTFTDAGWDFVDTWDICEGTNYPKLTWQISLPGDFGCPDGVDWSDLGVLCEQWLFEELSADVWPEGGDGFVNFLDWAIFADGWQTTVDYDDLADFADQWLGRVLSADVWPGAGDQFVDFSDWAVFADAWESTPAWPNWNRRCDIAPAGGDEIVDMDDIVVFIAEWLRAGSYYRHLDADIAPDGGDGVVNLLDFAALAENWLIGF
jgi:hypothetical protein